MKTRKLVLKNLYKTGERGNFPRPDCLRSPTYLLDGEWVLCPDGKGRGMKESWFGTDFGKTITGEESVTLPESLVFFKVKVPFALESEVNLHELAEGGLTHEEITKTGKFWYFTRFKAPAETTSGVLHFGAVDYRAVVWLNGRMLGRHEGGYTPFSFPVERLEDENILAVLVEDSTSMSQVRGKQSFRRKPFLVWYDGCTGIWQSVWFEPVKTAYINSVRCRKEGRGNVQFQFEIKGLRSAPVQKLDVSVKVYASQIHGKDASVLKTPLREFRDFALMDAMKNAVVEVSVPEKTFSQWTPEWPAMHPVRVSLSTEKREIDVVHLLYGHRTMEVDRGEIRLNKKKFYQKLLLHQGYYPSGHYTPLEPSQYRRDIEIMKQHGFNGCRMHQKIEHPAFMYWADLLGFVVWEEMPSYYLPSRKNMLRLEEQIEEVMTRDSLHPSITTLVLFNESWGLYDMFVSGRTRKNLTSLYHRCKERYPGYLIIDNSGFHHVVTDITDIHHYIPRFDEVEDFYRLLSRGVREAPLWINFLKLLIGRENAQTPFLKGHGDTESPLFISEFGGYGFDLYRHEEMSLEEFLKKHLELIHRFPEIQGYCYTQFADTFQERNGLFTQDRQPKSTQIASIVRKTGGSRGF